MSTLLSYMYACVNSHMWFLHTTLGLYAGITQLLYVCTKWLVPQAKATVNPCLPLELSRALFVATSVQ